MQSTEARAWELQARNMLQMPTHAGDCGENAILSGGGENKGLFSIMQIVRLYGKASVKSHRLIVGAHVRGRRAVSTCVTLIGATIRARTPRWGLYSLLLRVSYMLHILSYGAATAHWSTSISASSLGPPQ